MVGFDEAQAHLGEFVDRSMEWTNTPAMAVALTDRERLLRVSTYGSSDISEGVTLRPTDLFEIGSIGKSFTAIALLQQHEAGRLDLHAPVTRYLPWFHVQSDYAPITVHHLMSHTAGLISGTDMSPDARYDVWALRETEAGGPPGEHFHYSNAGYKALGLVLEAMLHQPYPEIIRSGILAPLGMDSTEPRITHELRRRLAVGYRSLYDDRPWSRDDPLVPATWLETDTADGSIASTASDLAAYLRMLLNRGQGPHGRIFSEESFNLLTQRVVKTDFGPTMFYGYGLIVDEVDGHTYIGHGGEMVGYTAALMGDLDDGLGVIVLTNGQTASPAEVARYALALLRAALHARDLPPPPPSADPLRIENAGEYAGVYGEGSRTLTFVAEGERLILRHGPAAIALERRGSDTFYAAHPDVARYLLTFGRSEGRVAEVNHGPDWYAGEGYSGPSAFDYPAEWDIFPGHYRAHNPWISNFRVVLRKGQLIMILPGGHESALTPLANGTFRLGDEEHLPERLRFDTVVDGQAWRAIRSGCPYYRFFTP